MGYLEDFLDYCQYQRGLSENTIRSYHFDLQEYLNWLEKQGMDPIKVKVGDLDRYIIHLRKNNGNGPATVNRKIYCLKSFFKWLLRGEVISRNPMDFVQNVKEAKPLPAYLTEEQ